MSTESATPQRATTISEEGSPYLDAVGATAYLGLAKVEQLYGIVERGHLVPLRGPKRTYRFTTEMLDNYLRRAKR